MNTLINYLKGKYEKTSLEEFIKKIKKTKPKGIVDVDFWVKENAFELSLSGLSLKKKELYLVLVDNANWKHKICIKGNNNGDTASFFVGDVKELFEDQEKSWLCHLVFETAFGVAFFRIRKKGEALLPENTPYGQLFLDSAQRFIGDVRPSFEEASTKKDGLVLEFYVNEKKNTLSLGWESSQRMDVIRNYKIWHPSKAPKKKYKFDFSVVMAIYNCEEYLEETIESILSQDIGFEEHVQLILVDDGSKDSSGKIIDAYAEKYPNNIEVIHKENGGVASARNAGKKLATGTYVNFCDSDDKLSKNAMSEALRFFEKNGDATDVVTMPIWFFDAKEEPHWQNYKFEKGDRVIDLWDEWNASCFFVNASFFKNDLAQKFDYNCSLVCGEDTRFCAEIIMEKMTLGVMTKPCFHYRKRSVGGSLIDSARKKKGFYFEYFDDLVEYLFAYSKKKFGFVPQFIQNEIMMDLQWKVNTVEDASKVLSPTEVSKYKENMKRALSQIDTEIILSQKKIFREHIYQILILRNPDEVYHIPSEKNLRVVSGGRHILSYDKMKTLIEMVNVKDDCLLVEGFTDIVGAYKDHEIKVFLAYGAQFFECETFLRSEKTVKNCFGELKNSIGFQARVPITKEMLGRKLHLYLLLDGQLIEKHKYMYGKFSPINNFLPEQYFCKDGYLLKGNDSNFVVEVQTQPISYYEEKYEDALQSYADSCKNNEEISEEERELFLDVDTLIRRRKFCFSAQKERPIWLVMDREDMADDNGVALFSYIMAQKDVPADVFFVLGKQAKNYDAVKEIGPVVEFGSEEHIQKQLIADLVISSQINDNVFSAFAKNEETSDFDRMFYVDLLQDQKVVFLQHGVILHDLSSWLNRYKKNITGMVTSAKAERDSILLDKPYYYDEKSMWLTGLPRWDKLYEDTKKQITFCPTWRAFMDDWGEEAFVKSDYYKKLKAVFGDELLKDELQKAGYHMSLKIHPQMRRFAHLFDNLGVEILGDDAPYKKINAESALMVTDYSSAIFDFAYLQKPVIYYQFDREDFFTNHKWQLGYFDYERDGFGPVCETKEQFVDLLIQAIHRDCKNEEVYRKRCEDFFAFKDKENCRRVYEKILEL
ncbi:MAG: bifunctional glycosyltransferase family 2 protein/CDP-glycerol:glycerophosphate glycerophosphotransferase [Lachnospiraceae bacterium]|nr:bifunctional glycosyltransferase family 2 protein/CDP-glycerol:glycerophosphate glycerophosphotransferase [Lachnospiraceae bacterium]